MKNKIQTWKNCVLSMSKIQLLENLDSTDWTTNYTLDKQKPRISQEW